MDPINEHYLMRLFSCGLEGSSLKTNFSNEGIMARIRHWSKNLKQTSKKETMAHWENSWENHHFNPDHLKHSTWQGNTPGLVQGFQGCVLRKGPLKASPTSRIWPYHWPPTYLHSKNSQDILPQSPGNGNLQSICQRTPENRLDCIVEISTSVSVLFHSQKRLHTAFLSRLSLPKPTHYLEHIPPTSHPWTHWWYERFHHIHKIWHMMGVQ